MSHHHHQTLDRVFAHPTTHNLHWRDVVQMFIDLGATAESTKHEHLKVILAGKEMSFPIPHGGTLSRDHEISAIRKFLKDCGFGPGKAGASH